MLTAGRSLHPFELPRSFPPELWLEVVHALEPTDVPALSQVCAPPLTSALQTSTTDPNEPRPAPSLGTPAALLLLDLGVPGLAPAEYTGTQMLDDVSLRRYLTRTDGFRFTSRWNMFVYSPDRKALRVVVTQSVHDGIHTLEDLRVLVFSVEPDSGHPFGRLLFTSSVRIRPGEAGILRGYDAVCIHGDQILFRQETGSHFVLWNLTLGKYVVFRCQDAGCIQTSRWAVVDEFWMTEDHVIHLQTEDLKAWKISELKMLYRPVATGLIYCSTEDAIDIPGPCHSFPSAACLGSTFFGDLPTSFDILTSTSSGRDPHFVLRRYDLTAPGPSRTQSSRSLNLNHIATVKLLNRETPLKLLRVQNGGELFLEPRFLLGTSNGHPWLFCRSWPGSSEYAAHYRLDQLSDGSYRAMFAPPEPGSCLALCSASGREIYGDSNGQDQRVYIADYLWPRMNHW
ncbi:hypothetical protein NMY22_g13147 [Coprinellus aureogranulatus]|nr:hypothetical protein NMY22_g13147 [Coprinellus aureogranulatus]